ncbi:MAG: hypothetical protein E7Z84_06705 [Methanosphaera stadtmanae]|nr:hypothetical protein [Methanosphaera stadtmanae]
MDYKTSISIGLFVSALILFIGRLTNFPISGLILGVVLSSLIAAFIYNPSNKKEVKHRSLRGVGASFFFCLIFSVVLTMYYIPNFSSLLKTADLSLGVSLLIIFLFTLIGGIVFGSLGGSIGSTLRDICSVVTTERKNKN